MATSPGGCRQTLNGSARGFSAGTAPRALAHTNNATQLDAAACRLRDALLSSSLHLTTAARAFVECSGWKEFGYARLSDHTRERLGRSARWVRDLAALHETLLRLPGLSAAITGEDGGNPLSLEAARQLGRVAVPLSLPAWLCRARACSSRELKHQVRAALAADSSWPVPVSGPVAVDSEDCQVFCLSVPRPVRQAFSEVHDLYQAVEGSTGGAGEFINSLIEEAGSGALAGNLASAPDAPASVDSILPEGTLSAHVTGSQEHSALDKPGVADDMASSARRADNDLQKIIALQGRLERQLARILARMADAAAWPSLGYTNLGGYAEGRLGWSRSALYSRVQLNRRLRRLPVVWEAYEDGSLTMSAAQAIAHLLTGTTSSGTIPLRIPEQMQQAWVDRAATATMKRLQDELRAAARLVDADDHLTEPSASHPDPLDDSAWHASLRRRVGTARRRIQLLGAMALACPGPLVPLRLTLPARTVLDLRQVLAAARRQGNLVQMFSSRGGDVPEWAALLALLGDFVVTWDVDLAGRRPSVQRIYVRDGWRCMAPGCTSRRNLETHHIVYRSQGGSDADENLVCLCRFHHQMGEHGGLARVRGVAPLGLVWELGRDACGGRLRNELHLTT